MEQRLKITIKAITTEIQSEKVWVFDPICGSYSYLRGVETWSLSAGLVVNDEYLLGVVYQPLLGNLFYSQKDQGAFRNNEPIQASKISKISEAFIAVESDVFKTEKLI